MRARAPFAHRLEGALSNAFGVDVSAGRLIAFANNAQRLIDAGSKRKGLDPLGEVRSCADEMATLFRSLPGERLDPGAGEVGSIIMGTVKSKGRGFRRFRFTLHD